MTVSDVSAGTLLQGTFQAFSEGGDVRWVQRFGGAGDETASGIAATAVGPLIAGDISSPFALTASLLASVGATDAFVASLTGAGVPHWSRRFGGAARDEARALGLALDGTAYVAGAFVGRADFGAMSLAAAGGGDGFVQLLDRVVLP